MATNFPSGLDTFTTHATGDVIYPSFDNDQQDAIAALETKVGVNNSAVTTTIDYKLKSTSSIDPGHKHSVSSISATGTPDSTTFLRGDGVWGSSSQPDASTTVKGVTKMSVAPVLATNPIAVGDNDTRVSDTSYSNKGIIRLDTDAATSGLSVTTGVVKVNSGTAANNIVKLDASGKLPAVDGSQLTNVSKYAYGTSTRTTGSTGTQTIAHGLGVIPKIIKIQATNAYSPSGIYTMYSHGTYYNSTQNVLYFQTVSSGTATTGTASGSIIWMYGASVSFYASCAIDSTNITLTWAGSAMGSSVVSFMWEAIV